MNTYRAGRDHDDYRFWPTSPWFLALDLLLNYFIGASFGFGVLIPCWVRDFIGVRSTAGGLLHNNYRLHYHADIDPRISKRRVEKLVLNLLLAIGFYLKNPKRLQSWMLWPNSGVWSKMLDCNTYACFVASFPIMQSENHKCPGWAANVEGTPQGSGVWGWRDENEPVMMYGGRGCGCLCCAEFCPPENLMRAL